MLALCDEILDAAAAGRQWAGSDAASSGRRDLVPFGAAVMAEVLKAGKFDEVVFSALGVREGYLYGLLSEDDQKIDPLIEVAEEMNLLRSRAPRHADDLIDFTDRFLEAIGVRETEPEIRLRKVAAYLADIVWRGHPDYRGDQAVDMVAYSAVTGVDHPGRVFLAEVLAVRYMGLKQKSVGQALMNLAGPAANMKARLLGAAFRVAYPMSAAMPGVLPRTRFSLEKGTLALHLPADLAFLDGEHLRNRLNQLAGVVGIKSTEVLAD
jgi:exopolyphosphatase/guanosine-5'-triphosphate,3'-diphosphate pyrophosphatase